jgi:glycosyltransferase involved in cell wall biosynthesis
MGVLYFGIDINQPSVLWMRRMLEGLGPSAKTLVVEYPLLPRHAEYAERYTYLHLENGSQSFFRRASRRLLRRQQLSMPRRTLRRLERAIAAPEISVVLVHYVNLAVRYAEVWRRVEKPVFVHCHGYDVTWDLRVQGRPEQQEHPAGYVERVLALPEKLGFIANSKATVRRLREIGIAEERIQLKYLGVPMADTAPGPRPVEREVIILYLGRLIDCKGPDLVIQAFELAVVQGLDGRLLMAGDGPLRDLCTALREKSACRDRIELLGAVDGQAGENLRRQAHIFTAHNQLGPQSRQEEAFGVSIVEAMAAGIPVVSGRNGSLPEVVEDGKQGILVTPGDLEAHAAAFLRLAEDSALRWRMGESGWHRARELFTLEQELKNLRQILGLAEEPSAEATPQPATG